MNRGDPLPDWLSDLRGAAALAGIGSDNIAQCLLIRYYPGAGIGWHRDRSAYGHVIGVSLGTPAAMRFRRRAGSRCKRFTLPLEPCGAYHPLRRSAARHEWERSIAATDRTRHSITFRTLSDQGRMLAARLGQRTVAMGPASSNDSALPRTVVALLWCCSNRALGG